MKVCKWAGDVNDEYCKGCDGINMIVDDKSVPCTECAGYEEGEEVTEETTNNDFMPEPEEDLPFEEEKKPEKKPVEDKAKNKPKSNEKKKTNNNTSDTVSSKTDVKKTTTTKKTDIAKISEEKHKEEAKDGPVKSVLVSEDSETKVGEFVRRNMDNLFASGYLDTAPKDALSPVSTWQTQEDADKFLVGFYNNWQG